jgi:hypothetical protein
MPGPNPEQIFALAPDASSVKAGKELASPRKWLSLGHQNQAAWGECQGSARDPYQTQIDLGEPTFKCSCPSRKFPCKHVLGLFILFASQPGAFTQSNPPAWVAEWFTKRAQSSQKQEKAKEKSEKASDPASQTRRAAKREERVGEGLADLDLWLSDLMRQGLNSVQSKAQSFWETPAARLVDAQAPGMARRVREMAAVPGSGEGWQRRLLARAGELLLLVEGYQRLNQLPVPTQEDIRTQIGWTQEQNELLKQDGIKDRWLVLGKRVVEETLGNLDHSNVLKVQRTWLWGNETHHSALILSFAAPGQVLDTHFMPGTSLDAELVFFPGGFPLRALVKKQVAAPAFAPSLPGFSSLLEANQTYTAALTANPWLDLFPMALNAVLPIQTGESWGIQDADDHFLSFAPGFSLFWTLLALSGGHPIDIFCEWNGSTLWPLSVYAEGRFILLQPVKAEEEQDERR